MEKKIKVLIVDGHSMFREGIKRILWDTYQIEAVAEAQNSSEFLKIIIVVR